MNEQNTEVTARQVLAEAGTFFKDFGLYFCSVVKRVYRRLSDSFRRDKPE